MKIPKMLTVLLTAALASPFAMAPANAATTPPPTTESVRGRALSEAQHVQAGPAGPAPVLRDAFTSKAAPPPPPPPPAPVRARAAGVRAAAPAPKARVSSAGWRYPVSGARVSSYFGWRPQPIPGVKPFHGGTDFVATCGRGIVASNGGRVVQAGWYGSYGNWILIDHGNGIQTGYAHNSQNIVGVGQTVRGGQTIAYVGRTGAATGCHVHFEVRTNAGPIDPLRFLASH